MTDSSAIASGTSRPGQKRRPTVAKGESGGGDKRRAKLRKLKDRAQSLNGADSKAAGGGKDPAGGKVPVGGEPARTVRSIQVYVGNLDGSVSDKKVKAMFSHCGYILGLSVTRHNKGDPSSRGFAHITFKKKKRKNQDTLQLALELDGTMVNGRPIKVRKADSDKSHRSKKKKTDDGSAPTGEPETKSKLENALEYLETWANDRSKWKFRKVYQVCLLSCLYDRSCVGKAHFKMLLDYMRGLKGGAAAAKRDEATRIVADWDTNAETYEALPSAQRKTIRAKYKRAVRVLDVLVE